jgi:hypothetical protein
MYAHVDCAESVKHKVFVFFPEWISKCILLSVVCTS